MANHHSTVWLPCGWEEFVYFGGSISWIPPRDVAIIINMMVIAFQELRRNFGVY